MGDVLIRRLVPADAPVYRAHRMRGFQDYAAAFTSSFEEESQRPLAIQVDNRYYDKVHMFLFLTSKVSP